MNWSSGVRSTLCRILLIGLPLLFTACSGIQRMSDHDPFGLQGTGIILYPQKTAEDLFYRLHSENLEISSVKGIGNARIHTGKDVFSSRLAWAAQDPGKLHLQIIGPVGPLAVLAANGKNIFFFDHVDRQFYKRRFSEDALGSYFKIPLEFNEMIDMISGRIPIDGYDRIALTENPEVDGFILRLMFPDKKEILHLYLGPEMKAPWKMESFKPDGSLRYRALLRSYKITENFNLPFYISVEDANGSYFQLEMNRVWVNTEMDDTLFELTRPEP